MAVELAAVTPVWAPPVAAKMPVALPLPSPTKKASSSLAPMRRANSVEIYEGRSNTLSLSSSSDTFRKVPSL